MGDIILVEGMPVGNLFNFAWNLLGELLSLSLCVCFRKLLTASFYSLCKFPVCGFHAHLLIAYISRCQGKCYVMIFSGSQIMRRFTDFLCSKDQGRVSE